jgi:hypothetical protein
VPAKAERIRSAVPLRRFRYDAKHDILRCPRGQILRLGRPKYAHSVVLTATAINLKRLAAVFLANVRLAQQFLRSGVSLRATSPYSCHSITLR